MSIETPFSNTTGKLTVSELVYENRNPRSSSEKIDSLRAPLGKQTPSELVCEKETLSEGVFSSDQRSSIKKTTMKLVSEFDPNGTRLGKQAISEFILENRFPQSSYMKTDSMGVRQRK